MLGEAEAAAARLELERRMLAADAADRQTREAPSMRRRSWVSATVLLIGLPTLAGALYWQLGSPNQSAAPFAGRAAERAQLAAAQDRQQEGPQVEALIAQLEARLQSAPDDLETSVRLGQAYALAGQFERAASTYRTAVARHPDVAALHSALGEALVMASGGMVGDEARAPSSERSRAIRAMSRARFYAGLAKLQRGDRQAALHAWVDLIEDTPADAPWLPDLREQAAALATELGLDPARALPPGSPAGTTAADAPDARAAAARLEAQLAANPKDYRGLDQPGAGLGAARRPGAGAATRWRGARRPFPGRRSCSSSCRRRPRSSASNPSAARPRRADPPPIR